MDANGGSMDKKLQREILALELTIVAPLHHHVQLENRYIYIFALHSHVVIEFQSLLIIYTRYNLNYSSSKKKKKLF